MLNKSVAVIDVRSNEITAAVAERGVNNTFIVKSKFSSGYEGYAEGQLLDVRSFDVALQSVVNSVFSAVKDKIKSFYVSVPGEFLSVENTNNVITFPSAKKVSRSDVKELVLNSTPKDDKVWRTIANGKLYFILSDKRKVIDPVGMQTDSLRGRLCFYRCKQAFCDCVTNALHDFSEVNDIIFVPSVHAEGMYLIAPERRDEYALLFDLGFISSSISVVCGNGIAHSESFSIGVGHIAVLLMETFNVGYEAALALMGKVNLNAKDLSGSIEQIADGNVYKLSVKELNSKVNEGLDAICGAVEECIADFKEKNLDGKPVYVTGECVKTIRGATDHISNRLMRSINLAVPNIPYYDKPQFSSLFSLMEYALSDMESKSILRFFR